MFGLSIVAGEDKDAMTMFDWAPSIDVLETHEDFQVKDELPDVKREDVKVSISIRS